MPKIIVKMLVRFSKQCNSQIFTIVVLLLSTIANKHHKPMKVIVTVRNTKLVTAATFVMYNIDCLFALLSIADSLLHCTDHAQMCERVQISIYSRDVNKNNNTSSYSNDDLCL